MITSRFSAGDGDCSSRNVACFIARQHDVWRRKFGGLRGAAKRIILAEFSNILFRHRVEGKSGLQNRPGRDAVHP
jgi:hypothetical protein